MDPSQPYWAYHLLQLSKWYYHLLRHSLIYTIVIINNLGTYFPNIVDRDTSLTKLVIPLTLPLTPYYYHLLRHLILPKKSYHHFLYPSTLITYQVLQFTWSFKTSCVVDLINISGRKSFYIVDLLYLAFALKNGIKLNSSE
jgi:hypothetical protein